MKFVLEEAVVMRFCPDRSKIRLTEEEKQEMLKAVVQDWDEFTSYLAAQPLCRWSAQKQHEIATGVYVERGKSSIHPPPPKNDNADLAAALSSMA